MFLETIRNNDFYRNRALQLCYNIVPTCTSRDHTILRTLMIIWIITMHRGITMALESCRQ